jgi:hypothetical protein
MITSEVIFYITSRPNLNKKTENLILDISAIAGGGSQKKSKMTTQIHSSLKLKKGINK